MFKKILVFVLVVSALVGGWFLYKAVQTYETSDAEAQGFLICNKENTLCERSEHVHAELELLVCGVEIKFPKEKGNTNLQHTHKEINKLHWHAREKVDPTTKEPIDKNPRMLKTFFEQMEFKQPATCLNQSSQTTISLLVNGEPKSEALDYMWKDGDKLKVVIE